MRNVKILKSTHHIDYDGYYQSALFHPVAGDWEEVSDDEYNDIQEAVRYANQKAHGFRYVLIEYSEDTNDQVFKAASDFKKQMKKEKEKEEKAREDAKRKRDEKAQERKRKQLEKLKKELGEG
jgi:superfamily II RNA helicase